MLYGLFVHVDEAFNRFAAVNCTKMFGSWGSYSVRESEGGERVGKWEGALDLHICPGVPQVPSYTTVPNGISIGSSTCGHQPDRSRHVAKVDSIKLASHKPLSQCIDAWSRHGSTLQSRDRSTFLNVESVNVEPSTAATFSIQ